MEIIKERKYGEKFEYTLDYWYKGDSGSGLSFPCTADGKVIKEGMHPLALESLKDAIENPDKFIGPPEVVEHDRSHWDDAVGKCSCGREVVLSRFTNTCECGVDYNKSGDRLAPREQWGEETGEHWIDIVNM